MYIEITSKCNMRCAHCCKSATMRGKHMSKEVWLATLKLIENRGDGYISLGGGEPTLHPDFWHILIDCVSSKHIEQVWLATNGSQTDTALKLAALARKEVIACELSLDYWHDPIEQNVIDAFRGNPGDKTSLVRYIRKPFRVGRAKRMHKENTQDGCPCPDIIIQPDGSIRYCGCEKAPVIGNVFDGIREEYQEVIYEHECYTEVMKHNYTETMKPKTTED